MKAWWTIALIMAVASTVSAATVDQVPLKGADGKTLALLVLCNDCESVSDSGDKKCHEGAVDGWLGGKPCGSCLVQSNWGVLVRYPRDLIITGKLKREDGTPAKKHYVKLFTSNGWGARTQTSVEGDFKLRLGATTEREEGDPITVDIGERIDRIHLDGETQFSMYLLPPVYTACGAQAGGKP